MPSELDEPIPHITALSGIPALVCALIKCH